MGKFPKVFGPRDSSVLQFHVGPKLSQSHPCANPVALMQYLVRKLVPPGGLVIDPFCGSGSTGVAAICEGRRFAGYEIDSHYAELARSRVAAAAGKGALFPPAGECG